MRLAVPGLVAVAMAATALHAEALTAGQNSQLVESALAVLGRPAGSVDTADPDTVGALSRAAGTALAARFGLRFDGRWVLDPEWWDPAMAAAARIAYPVALEAACTADSWFAFTIDGLVVQFGAGVGPEVLVLDGARLVPVPPEGRPVDSEAHGFAVIDHDTLESLTEGDTALWRRCPEAP